MVFLLPLYCLHCCSQAFISTLLMNPSKWIRDTLLLIRVCMKRACMGGLRRAAMKVKSTAITRCIQQHPPLNMFEVPKNPLDNSPRVRTLNKIYEEKAVWLQGQKIPCMFRVLWKCLNLDPAYQYKTCLSLLWSCRTPVHQISSFPSGKVLTKEVCSWVMPSLW